MTMSSTLGFKSEVAGLIYLTFSGLHVNPREHELFGKFNRWDTDIHCPNRVLLSHSATCSRPRLDNELPLSGLRLPEI